MGYALVSVYDVRSACRGVQLMSFMCCMRWFIMSQGRAKLTDFGLAKQRRGGHNAIVEAEQSGGSYASFTSTYCGSHGYAAPEIHPRLVHGFAADLYSFGVLLLMLLMGGEVFHDARS